MSEDKDRHIHWGQQLKLSSIVTPAFIYSMSEITRQLQALRAALGTSLIVAVSACDNPDVLARLPEDLRVGARCTSRAEMNIVAAWKADHIYVGMPALDSTSARLALGGKFRLVIDAPHQIELLAQLRGSRTIMPITLRLNMSLVDPFIEGPRAVIGSQGMDGNELTRCLDLALAHNIPVGGLHLFGGRSCFGRLAIPIARTLLHWRGIIELRLGYPLATINLGGGLDEEWAQQNHDFGAYRRVLAEFPSSVALIHEVGRSVFSSAGLFATRVIVVKRVGGQRYAICDGGLVQAFLLTKASGPSWRSRPALLRRGSEVLPLTPCEARGEGTVILGATAGTEDVFGGVVEHLEAGDLVLFCQAGAYAQAYSPVNYLGYSQASCYVCT